MEHELYERECLSNCAKDVHMAAWRRALVTERIKQTCEGHYVSGHVIEHVAHAATLASLPMMAGFEDCILANMQKEKAKDLFRDAVRVGKRAREVYGREPATEADWVEWVDHL